MDAATNWEDALHARLVTMGIVKYNIFIRDPNSQLLHFSINFQVTINSPAF